MHAKPIIVTTRLEVTKTRVPLRARDAKPPFYAVTAVVNATTARRRNFVMIFLKIPLPPLRIWSAQIALIISNTSTYRPCITAVSKQCRHTQDPAFKATHFSKFVV